MTEILTRRDTGLDVGPLRNLLDGDAVAPGDVEWDEARLAWNLTVDQQPVAVVLPESAADVAATVAFAKAHGLRVAPQGTGHGAAALGDMSDTILLKTERMRGVTIDPENRIARAEAGTIWIEVVEAAAEHGLAALAGSSPDVGVVGYTLGGGLSWLARKHGIGANQVTAIEVVTASGDIVRTDWANEPDLFWALRGGGGSFGIVTAIEFNLFPISQVYAGILWFPVDRSAEILKAWRAWTDDLPDEMTSVGRILQFPPIPDIPEPIRGQSFVVVQTIWSGEPGEGAPLAGAAPRARSGDGHGDDDPDRRAEPAAHGSGGPGPRERRRRHAGRRRRPSDRPLRRAGRRLADPLGGDPAPRRRGRPARLPPRRDRRLGGAVPDVRGRDRAHARGPRRRSTAPSHGSATRSHPGRPTTRTSTSPSPGGRRPRSSRARATTGCAGSRRSSTRPT